MSVEPFTVSVPEAVLDDLHYRLDRTRWPDTIDDAGWDYGTSVSYLRDIVGYWRDGFDWRAQEARLNSFANFSATIDGQTLHFIHERGTGPNPVPLLLLHGWPSSIVQMLQIIPMLTNPVSHGGRDVDSFDVVAASLPGFGFSGQPQQRGMDVARMAELFHTLMKHELGYERFALRGTDLGAGVTDQLALAHPESVVGVHTGGTNPWVQSIPDDLSPAEQEFVANAQRWSQEEMAYAMLHATRPQTLSFALNDSPAGLAAWILEKFRRWSDCDGDLERAFSRDDLLTNLSIYWLTGTIGSSMRLYYETMRSSSMRWGRSEVPVAFAMPPGDMFPTPREWVERTSRVDRWTVLPKGGHFPEWEVPRPVAEDIREFFRPLR